MVALLRVARVCVCVRKIQIVRLHLRIIQWETLTCTKLQHVYLTYSACDRYVKTTKSRCIVNQGRFSLIILPFLKIGLKSRFVFLSSTISISLSQKKKFKKMCSFQKKALECWSLIQNNNPRLYLLAQSQQWKHHNKVWNMFKVNNKDTRKTSMTSFWCLCW